MSAKNISISAENIFTDMLGVGHGGKFNVSVYGTFIATATLQRSFDNGTTWLNVTTYVAPIEDVGEEPEGALYRIGVKTGDYTSGTVNVRIGA